MKTRYIAFLGALLFLLDSCVPEAQSIDSSIPESGKLAKVTAYLDNAPQTKTGLVDKEDGGKSVVWKSGNSISVFYNSGSAGGSKFTTSTNGPIAEFLGNIPAVSGDLSGVGGQAYFWGLYPYNETASCDGTAITTTLPDKQLAFQGDVADDLLVTVGRSENLSIHFKNACSVIGFTLTQENISKVVFSGNAGEKVAGEFKISFDGSNKLVDTPTENAVESITITPAESETFQTGETYYFATLPGTFSEGYSLAFTKADASEAIYQQPSAVTLKASTFYTMEDKDSGLTFQERVQPNNEIWYKTSAGTAITLSTSIDFGTPVISNTYEGGIGIIKCESEITSIASNTFNSKSITELFLPASVQEIGNNAFYGNKMTTVTIPKKVNNIGEGAFCGCQNLSAIIVEALTPPLGSTSMFKRTNAATIYVPAESVEAYKNSPSWKEYAYRIQAITNDPNIIVFADNKVKEICIAKWDTDGDGELSLDEAASITDLKSAFHNSEIEYFDEFRFFTGIQTMGVLTSDGTGTINNGNYFYNCSKLKSIRLPRSIIKLGGGAFDHCASLKEIEIPFAINITCGPFYGCEGLESFIDVDGERSHLLCTKPNNNSRSLAAIAPAGITRLEISTEFGGDNNIIRVLSRALYSSKTIEPLSIILHTDALQWIADAAFSNTPGLSVSLDIESEDSYATSALSYIGPFAFCATGIRSFSIPENVSTIGESCFKNCTELRSFYFETKKLKTIPREVFYNCTALQTISIPESVSYIETDAFTNCSSLTTIYLNSTTPPSLSGTPFRGTTCIFSVPNNVLNTYKNHAQWQEYSSRIVGR